MNQDTAQSIIIRPRSFFSFKIILLFLALILFSIGAIFFIGGLSVGPKVSKESFLGCPVPKEYCRKGKNIVYEGKIVGVGFKLPPETPMLATFDGQPQPGAGITAEGLSFKNIYLISPDGYEADYSFQGERENLPFAVKKGDALGKVNGEKVSSTDEVSLIFIVKKDGEVLSIDRDTF